MITVFDFATVAAFLVLVVAYLKWSDGEMLTLMHFMLPAILLAVANQIGNAGYAAFGTLLIVAGLGYTFLLLRRQA